VEDVGRFEAEFLDHVRASAPDILKEIRESKQLTDETTDKLTEAINQFKKGFATSDGSAVIRDEHVGAMDAEAEEKESVRVRKPAPKKE